MTGEVPTYQEVQKGRVQCRECGEEMTAGYLAGEKMTHNGRAAEAIRIWKTLAMGEEPRTYHMAFQDKGGPLSCPVERCPGRAATSTAMRIHFLHRHVLDIVIIL